MNGTLSCIASLTLACALSLQAQTHPRLLFGPGDIPAIREKIQTAPWNEMFATLVADSAAGQYRDFTAVDSWGEASNLMRCAFLYVCTNNDAWARRARYWTELRINDTTSATGWAKSTIKGLRLFFFGKAVALGYDMCFTAPSWDAAFRSLVSQKLKQQADVIHQSGGTEQNTDPASNWQGNRWSSAGLCYLAIDEPFDTARISYAYTRSAQYISENCGADSTSRGWNIEGLGYVGYPMAHVIPFGIAASRYAPSRYDLRRDVASTKWSLWTLFAATTFVENQLAHPDFGDDNGWVEGNGCFGMAFAIAPAEVIPGLKFWYHRTVGAAGLKHFDYDRAGTIFSILYFPKDVPETNPLSISSWRNAFLDRGGNGFFTFRNQYRDSTDMVGQIYLKLRGNKGHNGPDALSFRILGLNTAWAVGGGRYGLKLKGQDAYLRSMNTIYPVNPDSLLSINGNAGRIVGTPEIKADGSGHVVSSITRNNVGTNSHKRWFLADYSRKAGVEAVYVIGDNSTDGLFWQMCTLERYAIATSGNTFTISGRGGATMRGTVLYPTQPVFTTGTRIRGSDFTGTVTGGNRYVHFKGDGDYLVVLTVAKPGQTHPAVSSTGARVRGSTVSVGGQVFGIEDSTILWGSPASGIGVTRPAAPTGLTAKPVDGFAEIQLNWTDNATNERGYAVYRSKDGSTFDLIAKIGAPNTRSMVDYALPGATTFYYRVAAYNDAGYSDMSNTASAKTVDPGALPLIAFDSFEESPPGPLSETRSGNGWKAPWDVNPSRIVDVSGNPLRGNGLHGGNRAVELAANNYAGIRAPACVIQQKEPVWISFLARVDSTCLANGGQFGIFNSMNNPDWKAVIHSTRDNWSLSSNYKVTTFGGPAMVKDITVHIVVRIAPDSLKLWVNPTGKTQPPHVRHTPGWTRNYGDQTVIEIPGIGLTKWEKYAKAQIDRIVIGRTYESVTTQFEPIPLPVSAQMVNPVHAGNRVRSSIQQRGTALIMNPAMQGGEIRVFTVQGRTATVLSARTPAARINAGIAILQIRTGEGRRETRRMIISE